MSDHEINISVNGSNNDSNLVLNSNSAVINDNISNQELNNKELDTNKLKYYNEKTLLNIQNYIDKYLEDNPNIKNYQTLFGNFKTDEVHHVVSGVNYNNKKLEKDNYMRWASMSKILAGLVTMKCIEEGLFNLDSVIKDYLPELAKENLKVVEEVDGVLTEVACNTDITVRHLLQMKGGFTYNFYLEGNFAGLVPFAPKTNYIKEKYPELFKIIDGISGVFYDADVDKRFNDSISKIPLVHQPGEKSFYGIDYDILGSYISKVLSSKNLFNGSSLEYVKAKILDPLEMKHTWHSAGGLDPPSDASEKLVDVTMLRTATTYGNIDNTKGDYLNKNVWLKDYKLDDIYKLSYDNYLKKREKKVYEGGFGGSFAGPLTDYIKLLKLIFNKGIYNNKVIISPQFMAFNEQVTTNDEMPLNLLGNYIIQNNPQWGNGFVRGDFEAIDSMLPQTFNTIGWAGWWGTNWYLDLETGFFQVGGIQTPLNYSSGSRDDTIFKVVTSLKN